MQSRAFIVHALSPIHAGTGRSADLIDLPIARMRATGIPIIPGSTIKGVLRDLSRGKDKDEQRLAVFGPEKDNASVHAGALVVGDAVLLAMPVRSMLGTFAWVSSPLLLRLALRDLDWDLQLPEVAGPRALTTSRSCCVHRGKVYLEDLDLFADHDPRVDSWARRLAELTSPELDIFSPRFVIVDDETMNFLLETATQVDARVRLDDETRTVAQGALWLEESLPPESLLLGLMAADPSRRTDVTMKPTQVLDFVLESERTAQLGGNATIGRGRCRIVPVRAGAGGQR
ncbi:RAMP superfamily protein [Enhygromyxa salina]|uniref:RAMP superfamily protein n=1 Tax=Enhygromyxa salina TaxID=215803 RepID=A0A2S9XF86_9BACT|nr:type III-B CRISPR module RAMP protein Cmr4 [Enhygromyxa salina]PRP91420.1 RAMP superfamily protein [Enhygromyxa salina]